MIFLQGKLQLLGYFVFGWRTMQTLFGSRDGRLDLFRAPALLAWRPVQASQTVEDRSPNLIFGIGLQFDVVARIESVDGGDQADGTGGDQVFQVHALGQAFVNTPGDQTDLRQ